MKQRHNVIFRHQHELCLPKEILEAGADLYEMSADAYIDMCHTCLHGPFPLTSVITTRFIQTLVVTCVIFVRMEHFPK